MRLHDTKMADTTAKAMINVINALLSHGPMDDDIRRLVPIHVHVHIPIHVILCVCVCVTVCVVYTVILCVHVCVCVCVCGHIDRYIPFLLPKGMVSCWLVFFLVIMMMRNL